MAQLDSQPGQSFAQLLMIERPSLVRLARRILGDSSLAEDIAQTLWVRVQRITDPAAIQDKRAYLYRLALNLASDQMRRRKRGAVLFEGQIEDPGGIAAAHTTEARIMHRQRLDLLAEAIDELRRVAARSSCCGVSRSCLRPRSANGWASRRTP